MSDTPSLDTVLAAGAVAAPGNGATIATITIPAGTFRVRATTWQEGTVDASHKANLVLEHGTTLLGTVPSAAAPADTVVDELTTGADTDITVKTNAAFAAGSVVITGLSATRVG